MTLNRYRYHQLGFKKGKGSKLMTDILLACYDIGWRNQMDWNGFLKFLKNHKLLLK